jgi:signal transduction histidine kinase
VLRRFYRSDKIGSTPGVGLGLNLVAAIIKLHRFRFVIHSGPGGQLAIICPDKRTWRARPGPSASRRVEGKAGL